jgi:RNA polymerase sigma-70 factor (ECF subfamily)
MATLELTIAHPPATAPEPVRRPAQDLWTEDLQRVAGGEAEALARLYDESSHLVYGVALRILRDPLDAEEVAIDVYMQIWRSAARFDPCRGSARSWLVTLARSRAVDRLRGAARRREKEKSLYEVREVASLEASPESGAILRERGRRARQALDALPARERQAIDLAFFSGLSHSEVAEELSEPLGTVKSRIRTGLQRLRRVLQE